MKRILQISIIIVLSLSLITGCGTKKEENNTKNEENYNTNEGVIKDQKVGELKFTNTSLLTTENNSTLVTMVTNPTDEDIEIRIFKINVKDKNGKTLATLEGYVGGVIPSKESREITSNVDINLDSATAIEYEMVK